ncbi:hypothetical protein HJ044_05030 [Vibrio parahaemolyticus]|nr:hypothetical protein [Vibrio parahaemolyticus]
MKTLLASLLFIYAFATNAGIYNGNQNLEEGWALFGGDPMAISKAPLFPDGIIFTTIMENEGHPSVVLNTYKECPTPKEHDFYKAQIGDTWINMIALCTNSNRVRIVARTQRGADFIVQRLIKSKDPVVLKFYGSYSQVDISIPATNFKQAIEYFKEKELNAL